MPLSYRPMFSLRLACILWLVDLGHRIPAKKLWITVVLRVISQVKYCRDLNVGFCLCSKDGSLWVYFSIGRTRTGICLMERACDQPGTSASESSGWIISLFSSYFDSVLTTRWRSELSPPASCTNLDTIMQTCYNSTIFIYPLLLVL